jgi:hypothetical protein
LEISGTHPAKIRPAIAERAIATYTNPGDLVLDPMAGIGPRPWPPDTEAMTAESPPAVAPASPLMSLPGAAVADGVDAGVAAHYGNPLGEQRRLAEDVAFVDRSNRGAIRVPGPTGRPGCTR